MSFREHFGDDGTVNAVELMSPWTRFTLISDAFLKDHQAPYMVVQDGQPQRIRFNLMNGWAVYEFIERDDFRSLSAWKCVECWGGPVPEAVAR